MSNEEIQVTYQAPAGWLESRRVTRMKGDPLPAEVTAQPVVIGIWNTTEGFTDEGRPWGYVSYSLTIDGRENPSDLTQDEREYIGRVLEHAVSDFRDGRAMGAGSLAPSVDEGERQ